MTYDLDIPLEAARFGVSESLPYADWLAHVADRGWDKQEAFSAWRRARVEAVLGREPVHRNVGRPSW